MDLRFLGPAVCLLAAACAQAPAQPALGLATPAVVGAATPGAPPTPAEIQRLFAQDQATTFPIPAFSSWTERQTWRRLQALFVQNGQLAPSPNPFIPLVLHFYQRANAGKAEFAVREDALYPADVARSSGFDTEVQSIGFAEAVLDAARPAAARAGTFADAETIDFAAVFTDLPSGKFKYTCRQTAKDGTAYLVCRVIMPPGNPLGAITYHTLVGIEPNDAVQVACDTLASWK
jgi:hypothetical protein